MIDALIVFIVQAIFIFAIDHKFRYLSDTKFKRQLIFQAMIATMYVFVIPLIAKGEILSSIAYIFGSLLGTYISHITHKKDK